MIVGQYLQSVTKKLDMGAEILYNRSIQVPGNQMAIYSLVGRYKGMPFPYGLFIYTETGTNPSPGDGDLSLKWLQ